jgi:hypothetical protein
VSTDNEEVDKDVVDMSDAELDELYKTAKGREIQEVVDDLLDKENSQKFLDFLNT